MTHPTAQSTPTSPKLPLPGWAETIRRKYLGGESSMFLLHHNVFDRVLYDDKYHSLAEFLGRVLLWDNKQTIVVYDPSSGLSFLKRAATLPEMDDLASRRTPREVLSVLEVLLNASDSTALIVPYASVLAPAGEMHFLADQDRLNVITFHRWSLSARIAARDNVVFLQTESLVELNPMLVSNPRIAAVEVPMPDAATRTAVVRKSDPNIDDTNVTRLTRHTAGLKSVQIAGMLTPRPPAGLDDAERRGFIRSLLGTSKDAEARAEKLTALTRGMDAGEIRHLLNPEHPRPEAGTEDPYAEVMELVQRRKREIIEKECAGLLEFVTSDHDLSAVGGNQGIKDELMQIAENVRLGERARVPMGLLFVGPMGTGKTFVAKAFVKQSGLGAVTLKNFRSKWVGSTEGNLERVLATVKALGPTILIIDEGDRAFGGGEGETDGGTSSRVIARIKEFMSDPDNRGVVLFILMTNRPDKLDVDIKRAGRLDRKIPFFHASEREEVESVLSALFRRHGIDSDVDWSRDGEQTSARLLGYSNADLEAVSLLAHDMARRGGGRVTAELFAQAVTDYLPPRDTDMLEYMELLAVFETSRRSMLPARYREVTPEALNERLRRMRLELGIR
jgi:hypothetical protein